MKTVILALAGILIGGGVGTTGGALLLARCDSEAVESHDEHEGTPEEAVADSVGESPAPDSLEVDTVGSMGPVPDRTGEGEAVDSAAGGEAAAAAAAAVDAQEAAAMEELDAPPPGSVDPAAPAVDPIVLAPTPDPTALRRLARIFSNMKAEQAAAVMVELSDAEAERILVSMPERAAAAILNKMDPTRAAVLSRRVIGGGSPGGEG